MSIDILRMMNTKEADKEAFFFATNINTEDNKREIDARIARMYRDGRGVEKDLTKASELMKKAAEQELYWAKWEYFNILWMINTPESLKTMIEYGQSESDKGNLELRARLGRAYRDGKGVPKDLNKAIELMHPAADKGIGWAKKELQEIKETKPI